MLWENDEKERDAYVRYLLAKDNPTPPPSPSYDTGPSFLLILWYIFVLGLIAFGLIRFAHWAWTW